MTRKKLILLAPLAIAGFALFVALGGAIVMQLWNWLLPPLFGWPTLSFWQALGLLALCRILFGGLGGGVHRRGRRRSLAGRWGEMTPEEREALRHSLHVCAGCGTPDEPKAGA